MRRTAALVGTIVLVLGAAGCSAAVSIDDYADEMSAAASAYVEEAQALSLRYQSGVEDGVRELVETSESPEEEVVALVRQQTVSYLVLLEDAMHRFSTAIGDIEPAPEVEQEHDAYVASVDLVVGSLPATRAGISEATSLDEVGYTLNASGFADGQDRWTATCASLEQAVRDEGRGMDLKCEQVEAG